MYEWVLILTIITVQGVSIHSVPMYTHQACKDAGDSWRNVVSSTMVSTMWVCKPMR